MSSTVHVQESVTIARPPAEVWDAIADYSFDREWRKGLSDMTPGSAGGPRGRHQGPRGRPELRP